MGDDNPPRELKNPMRFALRHRSIDVEQYDVEVAEIDVALDEGSIKVHWNEETDDE